MTRIRHFRTWVNGPAFCNATLGGTAAPRKSWLARVARLAMKPFQGATPTARQFLGRAGALPFRLIVRRADRRGHLPSPRVRGLAWACSNVKWVRTPTQSRTVRDCETDWSIPCGVWEGRLTSLNATTGAASSNVQGIRTPTQSRGTWHPRGNTSALLGVPKSRTVISVGLD